MILKVLTSAICAISVVTAATAADDKILPDPVYFYKDWCPIEAERIELQKHFNLTMFECCIVKAERLDLDTNAALTALQPYMSHVSATKPPAPAVGQGQSTPETPAALVVDGWKDGARVRARQIIRERRAQDLYPSQVDIADEIAKEFRAADIVGADGKPLTGLTIKRHALKGISSAIDNKLSTSTHRGK
jgi:hypothetical protein